MSDERWEEQFRHFLRKTGEDFRHASRYIFLVAGIASLVLAAYSQWLPHTPPSHSA